jgi:ribosomal protein L37E
MKYQRGRTAQQRNYDLRMNRLAVGLCGRCGHKSVEAGRTNCAACLDYMRRYQSARYVPA